MLRKLLPTCAVALLASIGLATPLAAASAPPILAGTAYPGYKDGGLRGTRGFGQARPSVIFYGGDPTGLVCKIRWKSWGPASAVGYGVGWYVGPATPSVAAGHSAVAILKATDLGTWHGQRAYLKLTWSFPDHGQQRVPEPPHCL